GEYDLPAAMISASHNPFADNGIKLFAAGGRKLSDAVEESLEAELEAVLGGGTRGDTAVGRTASVKAPTESYADHLVAALEGRTLEGLRLALDCSNGAASAVAPAVCRALGADVTVIHDHPDGTNINAGCGSTYPGDLQKLVQSSGSH